jgi:1,4-alpha-glucan branching enzyme
VPGVSAPRGELAIVLNTHMPYVEGFGTWPFGEEWLWEAIVGCYLPLLDLLDRGAPLTLSLTPVLCDQLEAPAVGERFRRFVEETRRYTHAEDARGLRAGGHGELALELERAWGDYEGALESFERRGGDLVGAFAPHAQWTSSATHAVLPLLATQAGLRLQVHGGVESHRARFDRVYSRSGWRGGFWLPECAHVPSLEAALVETGVRATCVELTARLGLGARGHLRPLLSERGLVLAPIDRATIALVWSDGGYPAHGCYRDYHRHTIHHHQPWANDGGAYDHALALALARRHAADFVARTAERLRRDGVGLPGGGLAVCALDTELLGHWWYEGSAWLEAVVEECARQRLGLVRLDDALERLGDAVGPLEDALDPLGDAAEPLEPAGAPPVVGARTDPPVVGGRTRGRALRGRGSGRACLASQEPQREWEASTWGQGGDLSTWSAPAVADLAFALRAAELEVVRAGPRAGMAAVRELLALQSSDWAFMVSRRLALPYARERFEGHRRALAEALLAGPSAGLERLRNLAVHADPAILLAH